MPSSARTTRSAFTLIELMVVISVMAILLAIAAPVVSKIGSSGSVEAGANTVAVATSVARAYAVRGVGTITVDGTDLYDKGAALVFTPGGEIRICETDRLAFSTGTSFIQTLANSPIGFTDIPDRDAISLPSSAGVLGIIRGDDSGAKLRLLAPPFAVRFNENGGLTSGFNPLNENRTYMAYYDADFSGDYQMTYSATGGSRTAPYGGGSYVPENWDPQSSSFAGDFNETVGRYELPFEQLETVIGVAIYNKNDFPGTLDSAEFVVTDGTLVTDPKIQWLLENAEFLFFSRSTGELIREGLEE